MICPVCYLIHYGIHVQLCKVMSHFVLHALTYDDQLAVPQAHEYAIPSCATPITMKAYRLLNSATITIHSTVCTTSTNMHAQHHAHIVCLSVLSNSLDAWPFYLPPPSYLCHIPILRSGLSLTHIHGQHFITDGTANPMSPCVLVCAFMNNNYIPVLCTQDISLAYTTFWMEALHIVSEYYCYQPKDWATAEFIHSIHILTHGFTIASSKSICTCNLEMWHAETSTKLMCYLWWPGKLRLS